MNACSNKPPCLICHIWQESSRTWSSLETGGDFPQVGSSPTRSVTCVVIIY